MKQLLDFVHPDVEGITAVNVFKRKTARGIIMKGREILLIYTQRYDDYSFPGGGIDPEESVEEALIRELAEETGAQNVRIVEPFGYVTETRPIHYIEYDVMHQLSYFYICDADKALGVAKPEAYEVTNGSVPVWVEIREAIKHNRDVIGRNAEGIGFSIHRETYVLECVAEKYGY